VYAKNNNHASLEALVIKHIAGAGDTCNFEEFGIILGYINIFTTATILWSYIMSSKSNVWDHGHSRLLSCFNIC
jgi:hypothetical protein